MSYYLQDSDSTLNGYPQVSDLFPDGVQSKSELVDFLDEAFAEVKNDPEIEGIVNWVSYWTGFNANAGTVYALSNEYANQIGYNGPTTAKTQNFILVLDKYIEQNVRELVAKTKKSELASKSFNDMVKEQRDKNRIGKSNWQDSGTVAFENLPTPESLAKSIWGDLTNLIADACDNASFNTDTEVEICAGLADDYYSRVAEALIPMLQNFVEENKWS